MRAASLFAVFALARLAVLWQRSWPDSALAPLALLWQDVLIVLAFFAFERAVRRPWLARAVYGMLVLLAAVNVPVERVLSSPLTVPMVRAAGGTLSDSIRYHATLENLAAFAAVLVAGLSLPFLLPALPRWLGKRLDAPRRRTLAVWPARLALSFGVVALIVGPWAGARVDTAGYERNPLLALIRSSLPRVQARMRDAEWRASSLGNGSQEDLTRLRGAARGRNVLLVVLESTAARYLHAYGASEDPTPALTALAARSIVFENAYAVYPESVKGLTSILSSRYPAFDIPADRHRGVGSPSLATALHTAGYETALFHSGRFMYLGMDAVLAGCDFARLEDAGDIGGNRNSSFGIDEAATVSRMLGWIDSLPAGRRFFATYLPIAGHHPYTYSRPGPFPEDVELGRYRSALYDGDRALGALFEGLRDRKLERETLIVVIADHGEAFGQHTGNYGHTLALYEENVHVPFVMALPGIADGVARLRRTASLIDVAPTVLDLLGLDTPKAFQGESLLAPRTRMALFFTDYSLGLLGLRDECMKVIHELESGRSKMFDVCRDPDERVDLAADNAELLARYRDGLRGWSAAQVANVDRQRH